MAKQFKVKGTVDLYETTTKISEITNAVDFVFAVETWDDGRLFVPLSTTNKPLTLGGVVTPTCVYLEPSAPISVKFNGTGNVAVTISKPTWLVGAFTSAHFSTDSSADVSVKYMVGGSQS